MSCPGNQVKEILPGGDGGQLWITLMGQDEGKDPRIEPEMDSCGILGAKVWHKRI